MLLGCQKTQRSVSPWLTNNFKISHLDVTVFTSLMFFSHAANIAKKHEQGELGM